jgi:hypothetical protein
VLAVKTLLENTASVAPAASLPGVEKQSLPKIRTFEDIEACPKQ